MYLLVLANGNVTASSAATKRSRHDWRVLQLSQSDCQPGHFWNGTVCERCPPGYFQAHAGQTACDQCGTNTYSAEAASNCTENVANPGPRVPVASHLGTHDDFHGDDDDDLPAAVTAIVVILMVGGAAFPCITLWRRHQLGGNTVNLSETDWVDRALETPEWQAHAKHRDAQMRYQLKADQRLHARIMSDLGVDTSRQRKPLSREEQAEEQGPLQGSFESAQEV
jgi:hypothetical protein